MIADLKDVSHSYKDRRALDEVTWSVSEGVTGVVGVNGAGKSTLLRVLATELTPTIGDVEVLGKSGREASEARGRIGVMPQAVEFPGHVRVQDFLSYMAWLRAIPRRERPGRIAAALELVELPDRQRSHIGDLSGGMQRRLLFAQAILAEPSLLILDEPTAGLDLEQRIRLREIISQIPWAAAVVISSHLMEDLAPISDRMLMLDGGRKVFDGTIEELAQVGAAASEPADGVNDLESAFMRLRNRLSE